MSWLRVRTPDGRNLDSDQGESGYAPRGHHFELLWGPSKATPERRPILSPRCLYLMKTGFACQRREGHGDKHSATT